MAPAVRRRGQVRRRAEWRGRGRRAVRRCPSPDGRLLDVFVFAGTDGGTWAPRWRLVEVDRSTEHSGTGLVLPRRRPVSRAMSPDGDRSAVARRRRPAQPRCRPRQSRRYPGPTGRRVDVPRVKACPRAGLLGDDGTCRSTTGPAVTQEFRCPAPIRRRRPGAGRDVGASRSASGGVGRWDVDPGAAAGRRASRCTVTRRRVHRRHRPVRARLVARPTDNTLTLWDVGRRRLRDLAQGIAGRWIGRPTGGSRAGAWWSPTRPLGPCRRDGSY